MPWRFDGCPVRHGVSRRCSAAGSVSPPRERSFPCHAGSPSSGLGSPDANPSASESSTWSRSCNHWLLLVSSPPRGTHQARGCVARVWRFARIRRSVQGVVIPGGAPRDLRAFGYYERFVRAFSSVIERRFGPPPGLHAAVAEAVRGTADFARLRHKHPDPRVWHRLVELLRQSWEGECALYGLSVGPSQMTPTVLLLATGHLYAVVWAHVQAFFLALDGMERRHHTPLLHSAEAVVADRNLFPPPWALQDDMRVPRRHMRRAWVDAASTWGLDVTDAEIAALHDGVRLARLLDRFYRDRPPAIGRPSAKRCGCLVPTWSTGASGGSSAARPPTLTPTRCGQRAWWASAPR